MPEQRFVNHRLAPGLEITFKSGRMPVYPDMIGDQRLFQNVFGHGDLPYPQIPSLAVQERRYKLVNEEMYKEFDEAHAALETLSFVDPDDPARKELEPTALAALADAIVDSIYVLLGTAFEYGIPIAEIWSAVHKANMSKLWTAEEILALHKESGPDEEDELLPQYDGWTITPVSPKLFSGHRYGTAFIVKDQIGKVRKPPSWEEADIAGIIKHAIETKSSYPTPPPTSTISPKEEVPKAEPPDYKP